MSDFGFFTYGHSRENPEDPRNSVILTNYGAKLGCEEFCKNRGHNFIDLSPIIPNTGIDWGAIGKAQHTVPRLDFLYCQASCSLEIIRKVKAVNPDCKVILQRDSTHAQEHLNLMHAAMTRSGHVYSHQYENNHKSLLNCEVEEYALTDYIFVLSKWVKKTFEKHGLGDKTVQFTSQCSDKAMWYNPNFNWANKSDVQFNAYFAGQIGLRKGIFDLLEAWTVFWRKYPNSLLHIAGVPEHGIPQAVKDAIKVKMKATPGLNYIGWCNMQAAASFYRQAHVFVMPSVEEGSTMCGVEAAMCGTPIIATENAGIDLLEHGVTGWEVPALETEGLIGALIEAYEDRPLLVQYSKEIQRRGLLWGVDGYAAACTKTLENMF